MGDQRLWGLALVMLSCGGLSRRTLDENVDAGSEVPSAGGEFATNVAGGGLGGMPSRVAGASGVARGGSAGSSAGIGAQGAALAGASAFDPGTLAAQVAACADYAAAEAPCNPLVADSEAARLAQRLQASCFAEFGLDGEQRSASELEGCASALATTQCLSSWPLLACDFRGSLPEGAACILGSQCQSGGCSGGSVPSEPSGPILKAVTCGTCYAVAELGMSCDDAICGKGLYCWSDVGPGQSRTCVPSTTVGLGESCLYATAVCEPGLSCAAFTCIIPRGQLGDPCDASSGGACVAPLVCDPSGFCVELGMVGDHCYSSADCAAGLACGPGQLCGAVQWLEPGAACDDGLERCRVGNCATLTDASGLEAGVCPYPLADGTICYASEDCDADAECIDTLGTGVSGICEPPGSAVCH